MSHVTPVKNYIGVFLALMVLTAVTTTVAYTDLGFLNTAVAITIATVKALLVVLFFMHVKGSSRVVVAYACAGIVWLAILFVLMLADYRTRAWLPGWE